MSEGLGCDGSVEFLSHTYLLARASFNILSFFLELMIGCSLHILFISYKY